MEVETKAKKRAVVHRRAVRSPKDASTQRIQRHRYQNDDDDEANDSSNSRPIIGAERILTEISSANKVV